MASEVNTQKLIAIDHEWTMFILAEAKYSSELLEIVKTWPIVK